MPERKGTKQEFMLRVSVPMWRVVATDVLLPSSSHWSTMKWSLIELAMISPNRTVLLKRGMVPYGIRFSPMVHRGAFYIRLRSCST